jgi:hypothetical protein
MNSFQNEDLGFDQVFDSRKMVHALLLGDSWATLHPVYWPNAKYYLNPFTLKLEPILFDNGHSVKLSKRSHNMSSPYSAPLNRMPSTLLERHLAKAIPLHMDTMKNSEDLKFYKKKFMYLEGCRGPNLSALAKNKKTISEKKDVYFKKLSKPELVKEFLRYHKLKNLSISKKKIFHKHVVASYILGTSEIIIKNVLPHVIDLERIEMISTNGEKKIKELGIKLQGNTPMFGNSSIREKIKSPKDIRKIIIYTHFNGASMAYTVPLSRIIHTPEVLSYVQSSELPGFIDIQEDRYHFKKGRWLVTKPIIFPSGSKVFIDSGTDLLFSKGTYLIVNGSIIIRGTKDLPVTLSPEKKNEYWDGIYVRGEHSRSSFENVYINNIKSIQSYPLFLTGGITFYKSRVKINGLRIDNVQTEDALNLFDSDFHISRLKITKSKSDAIDIDFSRGTLEESAFSDIQGDAVDLSRSTVTIKGSQVDNVKDKAFSFGEASVVNISNVNIRDVGSAVVSKDGSKVLAANVQITNSVYSFLVYTKKSEYKPAELIVSDSESYLQGAHVQNDNTLIINKKLILTESLNVEKMYSQERTKK